MHLYTENYEQAYCLYEAFAMNSLENSLTRWCAPRHFLFAFLCALLAHKDTIRCNKLLDIYASADVAFHTQSEFTLCCDILDAIIDMDREAFSDAIDKYRTHFMKPVDKQLTLMLYKVDEYLFPETEEIALV